MPRIISHTPGWLSRSSPGFDVFAKLAGEDNRALQTSESSTKKKSYIGPRRTIARRGTEVFVVVGNTIRWADLPTIKDDFEAIDALHKTPSKRGIGARSLEYDSTDEPKYKTLKTNVHEQIQQLITSPNEDLIAIVTAHTVHVAILPDTVHLGQPDSGPIRIKTHTLGPTIHVLSQARVVDVLWHPLGVLGHCLITVTADAVVRLWELNNDNRSSFDSPTIALDLTKLLHASSAEDNVAPVRIGENKGFSTDTLGMEVASACFGGAGNEGEQGWSSMTLWIAMTEGEIYALCPLLPTKWQSCATQIPTLSTTVVAKKAYVEGPDAHEELQRNFAAQFQWLSDLDDQDPIPVDQSTVSGNVATIYTRPRSLCPYPRLQGPFRILPGDLEDDLELADLYVIPPKLDSAALHGGEDDFAFDDLEEDSLSSTVVCLVTTSGRVYVCLNLEEVEGQWLPAKPPRTKPRHDPDNQPELVLLEAVDTLRPGEAVKTECPVITPDIHSRYSFFLTHSKGVFFLSIDPWVGPLEKEVQSEEMSGAAFRMSRVTRSSQVLRERLIIFNEVARDKESSGTTASVVFQDSDLGYFLLTSFENRPQAVTLDRPRNTSDHIADEGPYSYHEAEEEEQKQIMPPPRQPYDPAPVFWEHKTSLHNFLDTHVSKRHRSLMTDEIRLSSATLEIMTEAHRVMSQETNTLGHAVADLFTRCTQLQEELRHQIELANNAANKVDRMTGNDTDDYGNDDETRGTARLEERLLSAQQRQDDLHKRHDALRKKLSRVSARALSKEEENWIGQVRKMQRAVDSQDDDTKKETKASKTLSERVDEVTDLGKSLIEQAKEAALEVETTSTTNGFKVPPDIRRTKMSQVTELMERQSALVYAAQERLERLSLAGA